MRILVSGGAGFIGSNTVNLLEKNRHKVVAVDDFSTGRIENLRGFEGTVIACDILDFKELSLLFADFKPEAVLHLAAQSAISTAYSDPARDLRVNGTGTLNLLKLSKKYEVGRFVFSSTSAVYREGRSFSALREECEARPSTPYGISKLAAEHYVRTMFPNHLILRYGNVYGPRQKAIGENQVIARAFAHFIKGDDFAIVGNGNQKRDFVFVGDIAYCNAEVLQSGVVGTFNAASGKSYSVNQVLREIEKIYDVPGYAWAHTSENDPRGSVYINPSLIRREVGWKAMIPLADGLKQTAGWWEENK